MGWSASASVSRSTLKIYPFTNICTQKFRGPLGHDFYNVCNMYLYDKVFVTKNKKAILEVGQKFYVLIFQKCIFQILIECILDTTIRNIFISERSLLG